MDKAFIVNGDRCTGCRVCELVCSMARSGEYNPVHACIKIMKHSELDVNIPVIRQACNYCGKCTQWCFVEAIEIVSLPEAAIVRKNEKIGRFPAPVMR